MKALPKMIKIGSFMIIFPIFMTIVLDKLLLMNTKEAYFFSLINAMFICYMVFKNQDA